MFVPMWLVWMVLVLLVVLAGLAARQRGPSTGSGRAEMVERQRRETPIASFDQLEVLAAPEVRSALAAGHKIEAIRLVRERTGLGLREAKELVERHGG